MGIKVGDRLELMMEDVYILPGNWRNFRGEKTQYNDAGKRNFNFIIKDPNLAEQMSRDGWNVKTTKERVDDEGGSVGNEPYLKVQVKYDGGRPPTVVMITSRGRTYLSENEVGLLDFSNIINADVKISGKAWEVNGRPVMSCYLSALYVTIEEDYLQQKYGDLPMAGASSDQFDPEQQTGQDDMPEWAQ